MHHSRPLTSHSQCHASSSPFYSPAPTSSIVPAFYILSCIIMQRSHLLHPVPSVMHHCHHHIAWHQCHASLSLSHGPVPVSCIMMHRSLSRITGVSSMPSHSVMHCSIPPIARCANVMLYYASFTPWHQHPTSSSSFRPPTALLSCIHAWGSCIPLMVSLALSYNHCSHDN
jgi:hypothetical protein